MATNWVKDGHNIGVLESLLTHPTHSDGFVNSGDPVYVNKLCGFALIDAAAATDTVPIQTTGVFSYSVRPHDGSSSTAIAVGNYVYYDGSSATLNKNSAGVLFGIALEANATATSSAINIKLLL